MYDVMALLGCQHETCKTPVQVRIDPDTDEAELFCVTCDILVISDHVLDAYCTTTRRAPEGTHSQRCGEIRGHDGLHVWLCDLPSRDGSLVCCLEADEPHVHGHDYGAREFDPSPSCKALVRIPPHGLVFGCNLEHGHERPHLASGSYIFGSEEASYHARWERTEPLVDYVPDEEGIRFVPREDPPITCGRCCAERRFLAHGEDCTTWQCAKCNEVQIDVREKENEVGSQAEANEAEFE